ncbi:unnamed protein product [Prorocentrum cordatum]|uniref:C2 domain-containing protein n=1 Tax=Prorocentrum cordatum TaxID=2364126 RepID=A0ABN9TLN6_9DINO|nr:unnamed protein product [Polarella glacialis]
MLNGLPHVSSGRAVSKISAGTEALKTDLYEKLPFHENRWMCLTKSMTAALCLEPVARLEVTIVKAKDIVPNAASFVGSAKQAPHPFVRAYVDDERQKDKDGRVKETAHVKNSRNPEWNSHFELDITAGRSMVRFHLYDQDVDDEDAKDLLKGNMADVSVADNKKSSFHHSLGFVEVCVGDMPFDVEIEGWLELRFPGQLQGINVLRYPSIAANART